MSNLTSQPDTAARHPQLNEKDKQPRLPANQQWVSPGRWPYVGERMPRESDRSWTVAIDGLVNDRVEFSIEAINALPQTEIVTDIHCVTRWSKKNARFGGVLLEELLQQCQPNDDARFVSFLARSNRNHSSSLSLKDAARSGSLLATHYDGQPLPVDHGGPLRMVVPGKYFYKSVKWVERIVLMEEDQLGFWESESGYHNNADPWLEQRYIAGSISKREAVRLIATRDFAGQDLLSIDVASLDLNGLRAKSATLRNANFNMCILFNADFRNANLSNASFRNADLREANFCGADLEGAKFEGADLCGADLRGCSFFGTSFCDTTGQSTGNDAVLDRHTHFDLLSLDVLTQTQREFLERHMNSIR